MKENATAFPYVDRQLLDALAQKFPLRMPDTLLPVRELDRRLGHADVIRFLQKELTRQQDNILE